MANLKTSTLRPRRPPSGRVGGIAAKDMEADGNHSVTKSLPSAAGAKPLPHCTFGKARPNGDDVGVRIDATSNSMKFPLCDAAVRKLAHDAWELADAILAECSEPGLDGIRNESYAKMKAMREEIAKNPGVELSFERIAN